ncbi:MAG: metal-binding protein, partial [Spirochaetaceae bacterium]|nr:metal-binding protein [Spirochaetaceae bacterium]
MKIYKLMNENGEITESPEPGTPGGNRDLRIYGRLDRWSANIYVKKGSYQRARVFFKDEATA